MTDARKMFLSSRKQRKSWTTEATVALLKCFIEIKGEFRQARKKRFAYEKILKELKDKKLIDPSATHQFLESRMHTLLKAYRAQNTHKSSKLHDIIPYLKEVFGDKAPPSSKGCKTANRTPSISEPCDEKEIEFDWCYQNKIWNSQTLNMGGMPPRVVQIDYSPSSLSEYPSHVISESPVDIKPEIHYEQTPPVSSHSYLPRHCIETSDTANPLSCEISYKEKLHFYERKHEAKMELKRKLFDEMMKSSERRFRQAEEAKMQRHREKMDLLKQLLFK